MPSASPERPVNWRRAITVDVVDGSGARAVGAELHFVAGDSAIGTVTLGAYVVRLEFEEPVPAPLLMTATFWGETSLPLVLTDENK